LFCVVWLSKDFGWFVNSKFKFVFDLLAHFETDLAQMCAHYYYVTFVRRIREGPQLKCRDIIQTDHLRSFIINKMFSYNTKSKDEHEEAARPD
jgi:hypothetical protein